MRTPYSLLWLLPFVAVRYAWTTNIASCNLYNKERLPATAFRTDDWPGVTTEKTYASL